MVHPQGRRLITLPRKMAKLENSLWNNVKGKENKLVHIYSVSKWR